jgi:hypothetical protein
VNRENLIGVTIESKPSPPWGAFLFALAALGFFAAAIVWRQAALVAAGIVLAAVAAALFISRDRPFRAELTESSLRLGDSQSNVAYVDMTAVASQRSARFPSQTRCPISITHASGNIDIPAEINIPSNELEQFLRKRLQARIVSVPDPDLDEYLQKQLREFGPEQVFWFQAAAPRSSPVHRLRIRAWIACFIAGLALLVIGAIASPGVQGGAAARARDDQIVQWFAVGLAATVFGFVGWMLSAAVRRSSRPKVKEAALSSLVVGPSGMALRQGDLKGELRWAEIRGVQLRNRPPLKIQLAGATIPIWNIYDSPLIEIYDRIRQYR